MSTQQKKGNKEAKVVDFSSLDEQNKTEFMEFLLKNNICFEKGKSNSNDDFVAKVTIDSKSLLKNPPLKNKNNISNKSLPKKNELKTNPTKKLSNKENMITPKKKTDDNKQQVTKNEKQKQYIEKKKKEQNLSLNTKQKTIPHKPTTQFRTPKSQTNLKVKASRSNNQKDLKQQFKTQSSKRNKIKNEEQQENKKISFHNQMRKKINDEKDISDHMNKYIKIFQLKRNGQRPIKWLLLHLNKTIENIYSEVFMRNTEQLVLGKKNFRPHQFVKMVKEYFQRKFKVQKLYTSNLINFLYSMSYFQEKKKEGNRIEGSRHENSILVNIQVFDHFITEEYEYEDLVFYLFVRNILIKKLIKEDKKNYKNMVSKNGQNQQILEQPMILNNKDIGKTIKALAGDDKQLIQDYKMMIFCQIRANVDQKKQDFIKVTSTEFLHIVVEDYRCKRLMQEQFSSIQPINDHQTHKNNPKKFNTKQQHIYEQNQFQLKNNSNKMFRQPTVGSLDRSAGQLTFGQDTYDRNQIFIEENYQLQKFKQFWKCHEKDTINIEDNGSLQSTIKLKLSQNVNQLVCIIIENQNDLFCVEKKQSFEGKQNFLHKLVCIKALKLLECVIQMDKMSWFEILDVEDPQNEDIERIEDLQIIYRSLKNTLDLKMVDHLCKNLLTTPQFTEALQTLLL